MLNMLNMLKKDLKVWFIPNVDFSIAKILQQIQMLWQNIQKEK